MIRFPRTVAGAVAVVALAAGALVATQSASASTTPYRGYVRTAYQHRDGTISVDGFAYDHRHPSASIQVCLAVAGRCVRTVRANQVSTAFDRSRHIGGRHRFAVRLPAQRPAVRILLRSAGHVLSTLRSDSPGARAVRVAKRYVGARYVEGGASPRTGFDCSGYTLYVFHRADVAALPHNAQAQRSAPHMHRIARSNALPGDLIFYLSGRSAYHVAIYAGHGYQYAAATPRDGVRYQRIWSSDVVFGTDWH
ncbi:MAG TPA: NlpC/P60 family protein [Jatrophihabitans sp.]